MIRHDFAPLIRCFFFMPASSKTSRGIFYSSGVAISCASPNCQLPEIKFSPACCAWLLYPGIPLCFSLLNLTSPLNTRLQGRSSFSIMLGVISGFGNPLKRRRTFFSLATPIAHRAVSQWEITTAKPVMACLRSLEASSGRARAR